MKIHLLLLVERDSDGQFTGEILPMAGGSLVGFSGTPELVKVMEEVLPLDCALVGSARGTGPGSGPGPAGG